MWRRIKRIKIDYDEMIDYIKDIDTRYKLVWGNLSYLLEGDVLVLNLVACMGSTSKTIYSLNIDTEKPTSKYKDMPNLPKYSLKRLLKTSKSRFRKWVRKYVDRVDIHCNKCNRIIKDNYLYECPACDSDLCKKCKQALCYKCGKQLTQKPTWWKKIIYCERENLLADDETKKKDVYSSVILEKN